MRELVSSWYFAVWLSFKRFEITLRVLYGVREFLGFFSRKVGRNCVLTAFAKTTIESVANIPGGCGTEIQTIAFNFSIRKLVNIIFEYAAKKLY